MEVWETCFSSTPTSTLVKILLILLLLLLRLFLLLHLSLLLPLFLLLFLLHLFMFLTPYSGLVVDILGDLRLINKLAMKSVNTGEIQGSLNIQEI